MFVMYMLWCDLRFDCLACAGAWCAGVPPLCAALQLWSIFWSDGCFLYTSFVQGTWSGSMCSLCLVSRSCRKRRRSVEKEGYIIGCTKIDLLGFGLSLLSLKTLPFWPSALRTIRLSLRGKLLARLCKA